MKNFKRLSFLLALMVISHGVWSFTPGFESANPTTVMHFIQGNNALVYLAVFFGLGILLAFTPCVLPMIPILSGIIVGQRSLSPSKAMKLSISYVIGMAITYAAAGVVAGFMGSTLQTLMQRPSIIIAFSLLFVLMALSMFGLFELRLPASLNTKLASLSQKNNKASFISVALMGVISTLVVSPCVTAPLIGVLTYIGQSGQAWMGGMILFVMALGMGIPLIVVGAGYGALLPKAGSWMVTIKKLFGLIMLAMAIWMAGRILPEGFVQLLWAALLIVGSISLGSLRTPLNKSGYIFQGLGVIALMSGAVLGYSSVTSVMNNKIVNSQVKSPFIQVHSVQGIEEKLLAAKKENKTVFLEFYATWCSDCQEMEKVFHQATVANAMTNFINLQVDISDSSDPEVKKIKETFAIYGTPTMLFFNAEGQPLKQLNAVGYMDKEAFIALLNKV